MFISVDIPSHDQILRALNRGVDVVVTDVDTDVINWTVERSRRTGREQVFHDGKNNTIECTAYQNCGKERFAYYLFLQYILLLTMELGKKTNR